ncbi:sensor histidine kinase [Herbiconiux sp. SYSU D00978]|uniref:sensor histidine kinase n=1 Tax=Herbiconiux sp. SYSU D00978 TaxID=2812562 RepID=UPI001A9768F7|nr:ATP-binding protein [Herbiconiux sp. SYSU D00978]
MDPSFLVPVALAVGLVLGAGVAIALQLSAKRGHRAATVMTPTVPDGVDAVLDALESAGVVIDPSNNVLKASPGAHTLGLVFNGALVHDALLDRVAEVRRTGESISEEIDLPRGPFSDVVVHLFVRVARLGTRYVLLLAEDRTETRRLEAVRRDFVANISHELKTPIGAVGLLAEAIESVSDEPDQVKRFAKRLRKESKRLGQLTQEIIELSRLQSETALRKPAIVRIDRVIDQAVDQNRVEADARRITLASGGERGSTVWGEEPLLVIAVHNLIANAIQYSPEGSRVGIGASRHDGVVEIAITDQGVGIPEEDLGRVFERFFRVDPARSRNTGGTGLGLSIVKHVVQNHGGDVRVWSQPGKGSTFTIRLPEATSAPEAAEPRTTPKEVTA